MGLLGNPDVIEKEGAAIVRSGQPTKQFAPGFVVGVLESEALTQPEVVAGDQNPTKRQNLDFLGSRMAWQWCGAQKWCLRWKSMDHTVWGEAKLTSETFGGKAHLANRPLRCHRSHSG